MMRHIVRRFRHEKSGSVAVEFALIGPALIAMFMGVLQIGIGMQNYNALRGISTDVARYAVVNYQTANHLTTSQLQDYANGVAIRAPYGLQRVRFNATISTATTQRVTGATEYTMQLTYRVPTFLAVIGLRDIPLTYNRPIFVLSS